MAGLRLENTGASWMLKMDQMTSSLTGGPLDSEYKVAQMHAHWGSKDGKGSEHTVDGISYDAELHIVHFNTKYGDLATAVDKPDGLAVLGMFLKLGEEHEELDKICQSLEDIKMKYDATDLQEDIDPVKFLSGTIDRTSDKKLHIDNFRKQELLLLSRLSNYSPSLGICYLDCIQGSCRSIQATGNHVT